MDQRKFPKACVGQTVINFISTARGGGGRVNRYLFDENGSAGGYKRRASNGDMKCPERNIKDFRHRMFHGVLVLGFFLLLGVCGPLRVVHSLVALSHQMCVCVFSALKLSLRFRATANRMELSFSLSHWFLCILLRSHLF